MDPLLMMRPPGTGLRAMDLMAARAQSSGPVTFVFNTFLKSEGETSHTLAGGILMPALLKRRSTRPYASSAAAKRPSTSCSEVTSVETHMQGCLGGSMASVSSSAVLRRPARTRKNPPSARRRATARPMPLPPPVMTATLSVTAARTGRLSSLGTILISACSADGKSAAYSRTIVSASGASGTPNAFALAASILVGNDATTAESFSSTS
mmetsp:Transcript_25292/g.50369  ORF Transcript_25292/g.50369 Transcript_25292/m.50369 type:complete len:209 (+) Transcript_25292:483-1109(+)